MARLPLKPSVVKKLFALSGNICAYPSCLENIVNDKGNLVGEICHIEAAEPGGQRYNDKSNDEYRRSFDNLMLMCSNHHKRTNDVTAYSTSRLTKFKSEHEKKFQKNSYSVSDQVTELAIDKYMEQQNKNEGSGNQINNQANTQNIGSQIGTQHVHNYGNENSDKPHLDGARKVVPRLKTIIDKNRKVASPPDVTVIDYQNELQDKIARSVELVPTRLLKFRKDNGRIKAEVESYEKANNIVLDESEDQTQEKLKEFLIKNDKEKNDELKRLLIHKGQKDPAIVTCDGFLINGNRRKMALEELYSEKNQDPKYEMMRVVILPEGATDLDVQKIENRYQLQGEGKSEYHGLNRALTIKRNIEKGFTLEAQLRDDPNYHDLPPKEFGKKVDEYKKMYLNPLECVDRYLETFGRSGLYNTISESAGDREGRWQAFIDYSTLYYSTLSSPAKLVDLKVKTTEVGKIENAIFKVIRKRSLNSKELESSIGKVHDFVRKAKRYIGNEEAKKYLIGIADTVKEDIPNELKYDKDGNKYEEREIDEKWGNHFKTQILGNLMQAHKIVSDQQGRDKPLELLEDALKKLKHDNLRIENMDASYYEKALDLAQKIISEAEIIHKAVDTARYNFKKLAKKGK